MTWNRSQRITVVLGLPWSGKNIQKMKFFPGQGKVREFCGWPGKIRKDLESRGKVRELEINSYGRQSSENLFKMVKDVLSHSPSSLGATLIGKKLLPWGANSCL